MILLLTDGALKSEAEGKSLKDIENEVKGFKEDYPQSNFKLLTLLFGDSKESPDFITKLTEKTVKTS